MEAVPPASGRSANPEFCLLNMADPGQFSLCKNLFIAFGYVLMEVYPSSVQELDAPVLQKGRIEFAGDF